MVTLSLQSEAVRVNSRIRDDQGNMIDRIIVGLRWLIILVVLIVYLARQFLEGRQELFLLLIGLAILYNIALSVLALWRRLPPALALASYFVDGLLIVGLIVLSGGLHSLFLLLLFLPLLVIAQQAGLAWGLLAALLASLTYLALAWVPQPVHELSTLLTASLQAAPYAIAFFLVVIAVTLIAWGEQQRLRREQQQTAESQRRLQEAYERMQVAYDVAATLRSTMNYERVLEAILNGLARFVNSQVGFVLLFGGRGDELRVVAGRGLFPSDGDRVLRATIGGAIGRVLAGAEILTVQEPARDPGLGQFAALQEMRTALCLPLRAGFELFGIVVVASKETQTFSPEQLTLLEGLTNQGVIALQNSMLYQSLREERDRIIDAEEEARHQLARDLHDGPAQGLAAIVMKADFIRRLLERDPGRVPDELKALEDIARQTTKEVRTLLFQLRPISLETQGLVSTLNQYAEKLRETEGLEVTVEAETLPELNPNVAATVFTIIQEAVNNAKKHAGTTEVFLRLGVRDENLFVEVEDHGRGFDLSALEATYDSRGSLGLLNMRERAERIGGVFSVESAPGQGTLVTIAVPLER